MQKIPHYFQVSPYLVFFLVHSNQVGVGIIGVQRIIAKSAGYDAWIGFLLAGLCVNLLVWVMYQLLNRAQGDLVDVHYELFGKWIGGATNLFLTFLFILTAVSMLRGYIEIVQVWMFQELPTWILSFLFLLLAYYIISGGFKIVAGICMAAVIIPAYLIPGTFLPLQYAHFDNLLPMFQHSFVDILHAAKDSAYTLAGFEAVLMFYPFVKNAPNSHKYAQLGVSFTTMVFLTAIIIPFLFFSPEQLSQTIWALLSLFKVIKFPFLQRWEYFSISAYACSIISNITLSLWMASRAAKKITRMQQKYTLLICIGIAFVITELLDDRYTNNTFVTWLSRIDLYFIAVYIPILTCVYVLYKRRKMKHEIH